MTSSPTQRLQLIEGGTPREAAVGSESDLVDRAKAGQSAAWSRLYERHFDDLVRSTAYLAGDVSIAEDLVQEAFSTAVQCIGRFRPTTSFVAWMRGICRNLLYKHWRKNARRDRVHDRLGQLAACLAEHGRRQPDDVVATKLRAQALYAALETLSPPLREAFVLRDIEGLSAASAADLAGTSARNIRVRATRARAKLRDEFTRHGLLDEEGAG